MFHGRQKLQAPSHANSGGVQLDLGPSKPWGPTTLHIVNSMMCRQKALRLLSTGYIPTQAQTFKNPTPSYLWCYKTGCVYIYMCISIYAYKRVCIYIYSMYMYIYVYQWAPFGIVSWTIQGLLLSFKVYFVGDRYRIGFFGARSPTPQRCPDMGRKRRHDQMVQG